MRGETPQAVSPWHDTQQPDVYLDVRLLPRWERCKRAAQIAGAYVTERLIGFDSGDQGFATMLTRVQAINQQIIDKHPYATSPNHPFQDTA